MNDIDTAEEADNIAAQITKILIEAFKVKENREPTNVEIQLLIEELTEERINSMLSGREEEKEIDDDDEEEGDEDVDEKYDTNNNITKEDDAVVDEEEIIDKTIIEKINTDDLKENVEQAISLELNHKRSSGDIEKGSERTSVDLILTDNNCNINEPKRCKVEDI